MGKKRLVMGEEGTVGPSYLHIQFRFLLGSLLTIGGDFLGFLDKACSGVEGRTATALRMGTED